jgi:signal transduction histidine kinase
MKCYGWILWLLLPVFAAGQRNTAIDTITDHQQALQQLRVALSQNKKDPEIFYSIANRQLLLSAYDSCIYYCNEGISLLSRNPDNRLLIKILHTKGNAQYYLDDKHKAEANWREALQLAISEKDQERVARLASNIGAIYLDESYAARIDIRNYPIADSFLTIAYRALQSRDSLGSKHGTQVMRLMATSFHFQKKYDSADHYYNRVITATRVVNPYTCIGALTFYAEMLTEQGKHEKALLQAQEAIQMATAEKMHSKDMTHIMHVYGNVLHGAGRYQEAFAFIDSSYQLLAKDYQKMNNQAYSESESKFKNQLLQYQVELEKQKRNRLYYIVGALLLLSALVFLWLQNRSNKRIAREKARQKQISIDAFIEGEEKEKMRIGRELHDGIAQEIVGIKLAMQQQQADPKLVEELTRVSLDIRTISHELMPQTLKMYGLKLAIEDSCQKILGPSGIHYEISTNLPEERLPEKIEITLYRIFQELVHNIIKHSQATEVLVQLRKMSTHILLVVEDNGRGLTEEKTNGIGISNLRSRVQLVEGNLQYDSIENEGTTAIVRVPV